MELQCDSGERDFHRKSFSETFSLKGMISDYKFGLLFGSKVSGEFPSREYRKRIEDIVAEIGVKPIRPSKLSDISHLNAFRLFSIILRMFENSHFKY